MCYVGLGVVLVIKSVALAWHWLDHCLVAIQLCLYQVATTMVIHKILHDWYSHEYMMILSSQ